MKFLCVFSYETEEDGELCYIEVERVVEADSEDEIQEGMHEILLSATPLNDLGE